MDGLESMKNELAKITVTLPDFDLSPTSTDPSALPESYRSNCPKEKTVLSYCDNFRRQFVHLYRDRKPLFLCPVNECSIEKCVCLTLRPTELPYREVYDYFGCAQFVADYLTFQPLDPPIDLPSMLCSPTTILKRQKGNCFDFSVLLCSLLVGAGYDAYCVSGYATREMTLMDTTRDICPALQKKDEVTKQEAKKEVKKYTVKPPKDLSSKFIAKVEAKEKAEEEDKEKKRREEEAARIAELEKPPPDKLLGLRIHCWVLVLSGKREVPESFFIESLTGTPFSVNHSAYLGIESIWNHRNIWVNMQDCSHGVGSMSYDLGDASKWEYVFPNADKPILAIPSVEETDLDFEDEENEEESGKASEFDLPPSWVDQLEISPKDFQTRCPSGKKTIIYKKTKEERFADYLCKDGLISKLSIYKDNELRDLTDIREDYKHRVDNMVKKTQNQNTVQVTEYFAPGRTDCLKEHVYKATSPGPETERVMHFYSVARNDGLVKREETPDEMTETFDSRDDFLYYRHVVFGKRVKKVGPQQGNNPRPILKMVERFHRNKNKEANEDVAERVFQVAEDRISLTFHLQDTYITACTREFVKPPNAKDKGTTVTMSPDMTSAFQVDALSKNPKNLYVYNMLLSLIEEEEKTIAQVRMSEDEVREILQERIREEAASDLSISVYDTERNEKAKLHRQELERKAAEEAMKKDEMELDYLGPFLARLGYPEQISRSDAVWLRDECLQDLKQRLIDKANLIQARFEKETDELQKKQAWYQQNQVSMTKEDEEDYASYCSEAMFRIHILELRLNKHKENAPIKYMSLEQTLRTDPRLADHLNFL